MEWCLGIQGMRCSEGLVGEPDQGMEMHKLIPLLLLAVGWFPQVDAASPIRCETDYTKMVTSADDYKPLAPVSIFAVLADPEKFHRRRISISGVFRPWFDRLALYPTRDHYIAGELTSIVYSELPMCASMESLEVLAEWDGKFVELTGVFNSELKNFGAGTLQHIELVRVLSSSP